MALYQNLRTKTIALVEPDPWIRDSLSLLSQCALCRLVAFDNAADGIRAVESGPFDVIICDHGLPGVDAIAFLEHAGRCQPAATRILIAGYPVGTLEEAATRAGVHACLQKPFSLDALERAVGGGADSLAAPGGAQAAETGD